MLSTSTLVSAKTPEWPLPQPEYGCLTAPALVGSFPPARGLASQLHETYACVGAASSVVPGAGVKIRSPRGFGMCCGHA